MRWGWRAGAAVVVVVTVMSACTSPTQQTPAGVTPGGADASPVPSRAPEAAIDRASVAPCPAWDEEPTYPAGPVPSGSISLRVCPGDDPVSRPPQWSQGISPPDDALVTGVGVLLDDVNARSGWPDDPDVFCTQEGRPRIKYVFGYPDGSTATVTHGYGPCHVLELDEPDPFPTPDSLVKVDAVEFRETVAAALVDQRRTDRPPRRVAGAPGCLPNVTPQSILPIAELDLATAALCLLPDGRRYRRVDLDTSFVDRLNVVLDGEVKSRADAGCAELAHAKVVGTSTWNDPMVLPVSGCAIARWGMGDTGEPDHVTMDSRLVADLLALPRGPWQRQP